MDSESIQNYVYPNECYQKLLFVGLPYPQVSGSFIVEHIVDDRVFIQIEFDIFEDRRTLDIDDQTYFRKLSKCNFLGHLFSDKTYLILLKVN